MFSHIFGSHNFKIKMLARLCYLYRESGGVGGKSKTHFLHLVISRFPWPVTASLTSQPLLSFSSLKTLFSSCDVHTRQTQELAKEKCFIRQTKDMWCPSSPPGYSFLSATEVIESHFQVLGINLQSLLNLKLFRKVGQ